MTAKRTLKSAAIVTIRNGSKMTPDGRKAVADWLRMHARMLVKDGARYSSRLIGRYLY